MRFVIGGGLVMLLAVAANAQDPYALRTTLGDEAYTWENTNPHAAAIASRRARQGQATMGASNLARQASLGSARLRQMRTGGSGRTNQGVPRTPGWTPQAPVQPTSMLTKQTENALNFYNGNNASARATLNQMPRRTSFTPPPAAQAARQQAARQPASKPFGVQATNQEPAVSPYLNLFRTEFDEGAPSYYSFVKPQLQQAQTNAIQSRNLQQLERQVQRTSYGGNANNGGVVPATGHSTRFSNMGQYYGGWQR